MIPQTRVVVTGSSGRIGSAVAALLGRDHSVIGIDIVPGRYTTHLGSIRDVATIRRLVTGAAAIIHTASLHMPHVQTHSPEQFRRTNVDGMQIILEAALRAGVTRLVYSSSTSVYGRALVPRSRAVWVTEELEPQPRDVYDETKLAAEALVSCAAASSTLKSVSIRCSRCFPEPPELQAVHRLYRGVDVRDVAAAHKLALEHTGSSFEVFNVSAHHPFRRSDCEQLLHDARSVLCRYFPRIESAFAARGWQVPTRIDRVYCSDKARRLLCYHPQFNFEACLAEASTATP